MKNVLFLSIHDWANSSWRMCEAINRHSKRYHVDYFSVYDHPFGYYRENVLTFRDGDNVYPNNEVYTKLLDCYQKADILHFKEDEGPIKQFQELTFDLANKPVVWTVCGRQFRKNQEHLLKSAEPFVNVYTGTTPDLLVDDRFKLLPFAFDLDRDQHKSIPKADDCIIIGHSPSNHQVKGTDAILEVFNRIHSEHQNVFINLVEGMKYRIAIQMKRINHIFVDQINGYGSYGNSAVEAMAFGSAVLCSSSYGAAGVINVQNMDDLYSELTKLVTDRSYLRGWQELALDHVKRHHSYPSVARVCEQLYDEALK